MRNKRLNVRQWLGRLPVQQGADAIEAGLGGGAEPAEVAHALEASGQDVLEEPVNKLFGGQCQGAWVSLVVTVSEGDVLAVVVDDFFRAQGGAIDIGGEILEGR